MEKIEGTEMNGENWYVKRDPLNDKIFIVKNKFISFLIK